jgi:hypothetical protein
MGQSYLLIGASNAAWVALIYDRKYYLNKILNSPVFVSAVQRENNIYWTMLTLACFGELNFR